MESPVIDCVAAAVPLIMAKSAVTDPVVLRVHRPYANEDDYLEAEAWTIDDKAVMLIDQPALPKDTVVRFEIVLDDGTRPIRAEGKAHKVVAADGNRPGGLRVRFRRFDAATKRFIDRVLEARRKERRSRRPPQKPLVLEAEVESPTIVEQSTPEQSTPEQSTPEQSSPEQSSPEQSTPEQSTPEQSSPEQSTPEQSTPEQSSPSLLAPPARPGPRTVAAPANRDDLLDRLRARRK
jgi:hypothetical protein